MYTNSKIDFTEIWKLTKTLSDLPIFTNKKNPSINLGCLRCKGNSKLIRIIIWLIETNLSIKKIELEETLTIFEILLVVEFN